jgi:RNA polymerase sigma-70 factor (ECF subfamily)
MFGKKNLAKKMGADLVPILPSIWRFAMSLSSNPSIADDLTQSTCLRAIEKAHQFKKGTNLTAWSLTICRSIWLNELRSKTIRKTGGLETASPEQLIDMRPDIETNIFASEVFAKVMALPEAQRATVELVFVQEFTYSEAANILDIPIGTVMSRLSSARKTLAPLNETNKLDRLKGEK